MKKIYDFILRNNIFFFILLIFGFSNYVFCPYIVSGDSMSPTYHDSEFVSINRFSNLDKLKNGDVIVFNNSSTKNRDYIKRVVAVPGDSILITEDGLFVNGEKQKESKRMKMTDFGIAEEIIYLADDEYFVLGDNRNESIDSRFIGPVKKQDIKGKLFCSKKIIF